MEFADICRPFDGSIFTEEYRGDFRQAEERLRKIESALAENPDVDSLASSLMQRICLYLLRGNYRAALMHLEHVGQIPNLTPRWKLRQQTYTMLCTHLRRYPSIIRNLPSDLTQPWGVKIPIKAVADETWKAFARYKDFNLNDADNFECPYNTAVAGFSGFVRCAQIRHGDYPIGRGGTVYQQMRQGVADRLQHLQLCHTASASANMMVLSRYIKRLEVELLLAIGHPDRMQRLHMLEDEYSSSEDWTGSAVCKLIEADSILASPFSNPLALNLIAVYSSNAGFVDHKWDTFEDKLSLKSSEESESLLQQAHSLFLKGNSPRGCAAVRLRQGCIEHMKCYTSECTSEDRTKYLKAAGKHLSKALHLFDLDDTHCQIVRAHQIMVMISQREEIKTVLTLATEIGSWGLKFGNEGISEFVGSLLIRFGRRLLFHSEVDKALSCFEAARECFAAMEEQYGVFQAIVSTIRVHSFTHNDLNARYLIEQQRQAFRELLDYFVELADSDKMYEGLRGTRTNVIVSYDSVISPIYRNLGENETLREWRAEVKELLKDQDMTLQIRETLNDLFFSNHFGKAAGRFLTGLSSFLTWGKGKQSSEHNKDTVFETLHSGHSVTDAACVAAGRYRDLVRTGDIDEAENVLRSFCADLETIPPSYSTKMAAIFVGRDLGDMDLISRSLNSMTDAELLGDWTMRRYSDILRKRASSETGQYRSQPHLDAALEVCALGRQWKRGYKLLQIIDTTYPDYFDVHGWRDIDLWYRFSSAGLIAGHNGDIERAFNYLLQALGIVESLRSSISDGEARRTVISTIPFIELINGLIFLCLKCRDDHLPLTLLIDAGLKDHSEAKTWNEHIMLFCERSRARSLLDSMRSQEEKLTVAEEKITKKYKQEKLRHLRSIAVVDRQSKLGVPLVDEEELRRLEEELGSDDGGIDFEQPMLPVNVDIAPVDLYSAIASDALLLEISYSEEGIYLLVITSDDLVFVEKVNVVPSQFRRSTLRLTQSVRQSKYLTPNERKKQLLTIQEPLNEVSSAIVHPVQDFIRSKKQIVFVMSFPMVGFPIGALELDGRPLCIQKAVTQVPSLSALLYLSRRKLHSPPQSQVVTSISKISNLAEARPTDILLPMAGIESVAISKMFDTKTVKATEVDRDHFRGILKETQIIHVGTHGSFDGRSPWTANLLLKEEFRALDLFEARGNPDLVVFSACLTGLGGLFGNETVGFSHVLLEAGCSSYLGALWEVNDIATLLLMVLFFRSIRQCRDSNDDNAVLAELWRQALTEFYNLNAKKAREIIKDLTILWKDAASAGHRPNEIVQGGLVYLKMLGADPVYAEDNDGQAVEEDTASIDALNLDFQHPYLYASFMLVGNGSFQLFPSRK